MRKVIIPMVLTIVTLAILGVYQFRETALVKRVTDKIQPRLNLSSDQESKTKPNLIIHDPKRDLLKKLSAEYIGRSDNCLINFSGKDLSSDQPMQKIVDSAGNIKVEAQSTMVGERYQIGNMILKAFVPDDKEGGSLTGYCDFVIEFKYAQKKTEEKIIFAEKKNEVIRLSCRVDRLKPKPISMTSCSGMEPLSSDEVWRVTEKGTAQFIYWNPSQSSGAMIIGPAHQNLMDEETAALNLNLRGNLVGDDGIKPLVSKGYTHSLKLADQAGLIFPSAKGQGSVAVGVVHSQDERIERPDCLSMMSDKDGNSAEHLIQFCWHQTIFGKNNRSSLNSHSTQLVAGQALVAKSPLEQTHISLISVGGESPFSLLSMNGDRYYYPTALGDLTQNFNGKGSFMMKADHKDQIIRWWMQPAGTNGHEVARFTPNFILTFGNQSNSLPTDIENNQKDSSYLWSMGEKIQIKKGHFNFMFGSKLDSVSAENSQTSDYNFLFGSRLSLKKANNFNFNFGSKNIIKDGSYHLVFGQSHSVEAENGRTTLIGEGHTANYEASSSTAIGKGAQLVNQGEVSFGKYPLNISNSQEKTLFTIGDGLDANRRFNLLQVNQDGRVTLNFGPYSVYRAKLPILPTSGYIIPSQTNQKKGGVRNDSWISTNLAVSCGDGQSCQYNLAKATQESPGFSAIRLSDSGEIAFYHQMMNQFPQKVKSTLEVDPKFLKPANQGGSLVAQLSGGKGEFYVDVKNDSYSGRGEALTVKGTATANFTPRISDRRFKKKIKESTVGLSEILQLKPREYVWKESGDHDYGFIAQEVKQVFPSLVISDKDYGDQKKSWWSIRYQELIAPIHQSLKQLEKILTEILQKVKQLRIRYQELSLQHQKEKELNLSLKKRLCQQRIISHCQ